VSESATPTPSTTPTAGGPIADPQFIPALGAIQMVNAHTGWAAGGYAIYATSDGSHWVKQYASTEQFVGVDFISATTGWVVGVRSLLGTTDGGRTWLPLAEPPMPIRSVHFISATQGWAVAGGLDPQMQHGWLVPSSGGSLVTTGDGGRSWTILSAPADTAMVCFSDAGHGWLTTPRGTIYASADGGMTWSKAGDVFSGEQPTTGPTLIECAAPSALWAYTTIGNGAAGHLPYVVAVTQDGHNWQRIMTEPQTMSSQLPGVPAGPDSHPGSFSVVDAMDAVFVGDGPATNVAQCVIASSGGTSLRRTGSIAASSETFGAAFLSISSGWVLTRNPGGDYVIDATSDGGYHWSEQLAVTPSSAG
jgi:photosystem II stability/assembly factor-like uncharacterized protein